VLRATPESVEEFRVTTSNPNATEGRSSGAQVSLVTRSGANRFHGSAYEFNRNTAFTANDWFNNQAGRYVATDSQVLQGIAQVGDQRVPRPKLNRNVFGFTASGPLIKNRLFFFFNYEGRRDASQTSVARYVPTVPFRQGILQYQNAAGAVLAITPDQFASLFPGTGGVNPVVLQYLQAAPLPNFNGIGDGLNQQGYRFNALTPVVYATDILRVDYRISDRQLFFVRGNYQNDNYQLPQQFPSSAAPHLWAHPKGIALGHDWSISNRTVNAARVGFTRESLSQQGDADANIVRLYTYRPTTEQRSNTLISPTTNATDDFSIVSSVHAIHFGGNVRWIRNDTASLKNSYDLLSANYAFYPSPATTLAGPLGSVASSFLTNAEASVAILLGRLTQYSANVLYGANGQPLPTGTAAARSFATQEYEGYAQDSWRIRPNLTLVYGIRYSVARPVYERNGFQAAPTVNLGNYLGSREAGAAAGRPYNVPISIQLSGPANNGPSAWNTNWNNVAPNVALAWTPNASGILAKLFGGPGHSVIRTGFREMFDRFGSSLMAYYDQSSTLRVFYDISDQRGGLQSDEQSASAADDFGEHPILSRCGAARHSHVPAHLSVRSIRTRRYGARQQPSDAARVRMEFHLRALDHKDADGRGELCGASRPPSANFARHHAGQQSDRHRLRPKLVSGSGIACPDARPGAPIRSQRIQSGDPEYSVLQ
jgi:hypothetical protein